jgi:hypothetical protein
VLVLLIRQILLMFHSREEIRHSKNHIVFLGGLAVMIVVDGLCSNTANKFYAADLKALFYAVYYIYSQNNAKSIAYILLHILMRKIQYNVMRFIDTVSLDEAEVLAGRLNQLVLHIMFCMILKN